MWYALRSTVKKINFLSHHLSKDVSLLVLDYYKVVLTFVFQQGSTEPYKTFQRGLF